MLWFPSRLFTVCKEKKGKSGYLMLKNDFERAYARVEWDFLRLTLFDFGFSSSIISWYELHYLYIFILEMEQWSSKELAITRGLDKETLFLHIFLWCAWKNYPIWFFFTNNLLKLLKKRSSFSHSFFANNYLLLSVAICAQARLINGILNVFCKASGLEINLQKSRFLASKNMPWRKVDKITSTLGFQSTQNINNYLDFPLVASRVKKSRFSFIVDKVNVCLARWK